MMFDDKKFVYKIDLGVMYIVDLFEMFELMFDNSLNLVMISLFFVL